MLTFSKFKLLCWKNFILTKRHPIAAIFEIIFPILVVSVFTISQYLSDPKSIGEQTYTEKKLSDCRYPIIKRVGVSPNTNNELKKLIEESDFYKKFQKVEFLKDSEALQNFLDDDQYFNAGIEFDDSFGVSYFFLS